MAVLKDTEETEKEPVESEGDEPDDKIEVPEAPADPNESVERVPADVQRESRRERRAQRQNEFRQAQEERDRLRRENEELRQRQYQAPPQQQQAPQMHPAAQRLKQLDDAEAQLHSHYRARVSAGMQENSEEYKEFERKNRELQTARMAVVAQASQPQVDRNELIREAQLRMYFSEHADITGNENYMQWALARWQQYRAEGKADTREMSDGVFEEARRRFGLKPRNGSSAPDPATRQRFSGMSSRGAGPAPSTPGAVRMSADDRRMARIAFGDRMSEKEAEQHWANTVGKKILEQRAKGG